MIYPSKLGIGLGALAATLYLVSLQTQSGLLFLVLGILFGCGVVNALAAARTVRRLRVVPPARITAVENEPVREPWQVHNPGRGRAGTAQVRGAWGMLLRVSSLAPHETMHVTPGLAFPRRGVYSFASLAVVSGAPFGLLRCRRRLAASGEIIVYPAAYSCTPPPAAGFQPVVGGKFVGLNRSSTGDSFHGVRPIQPQDPQKLIHWPSSAKGLGVMVKEFDEETAGRVAILLAAGPGRDPRAAELLDWATRVVASLMYAALDQGHQVEFAEVGSSQYLSVPPFADGQDVLEVLARVTAGERHASVAGIREAVHRLPRQAGLALVLTALPPELDAYVGELRAEGRRCALYLPEPQRHAEVPAGIPISWYGAGSLGGA